MILSMFMAPEKAAEAAQKAAPVVQKAAPAAQKAAETTAQAAAQAAEPGIHTQGANAVWETVSPWAELPQASTFAEGVDVLYFFIVALSVFFFVLIMGVQGYFMWKYHRKSDDQKTSSVTHNGKIEFLWSAVPAVLLVVIFVWGEVDFLKQSVAPPDAIQVRVTGRQWFWTVEYPDYPGVSLNSNVEDNVVTLVVPKGKPVQLTMTSEDVIHDFYIPAFRVKRDVVPGRYTTFWFEATQVGEFNLYCAEYCGDQHSAMIGKVKVLAPEHYEAYLIEAGKLEQEEGEPMQDFGRRIYERRGCNACHSLDGSPKVGPSWQGIWNKVETTYQGSVTVDDNYVKESILEPNAKKVAGFEGVNMPSYKGQLDDKHIAALVEFIKTLK
jgi:cytochrome c oxidase subunit 2